ncbi:structural maintenance of chromosomes protein 1A, partial [Biomphalaria glabrata]
VRRLHTEDKLTSLERGCDDQCTPGCTDTGLYLECFSCCSESLCNADNLAKSIHNAELFIPWTIQKLIVSVVFIIKYI